MALKAIGGILILIGLVDFLGSFAGFDLWGTMGIDLPEIIWRFTAYIELAAGYALLKAGGGGDAEEAPPEVEVPDVIDTSEVPEVDGVEDDEEGLTE